MTITGVGALLEEAVGGDAGLTIERGDDALVDVLRRDTLGAITEEESNKLNSAAIEEMQVSARAARPPTPRWLDLRAGPLAW